MPLLGPPCVSSKRGLGVFTCFSMNSVGVDGAVGLGEFRYSVPRPSGGGVGEFRYSPP